MGALVNNDFRECINSPLCIYPDGNGRIGVSIWFIVSLMCIRYQKDEFVSNQPDLVQMFKIT